ncbi:hypothetical protein FD725_29795 (plasmid) [Nostoc sp. TCL26-01]|nr:hypothetical protein FD725_29795 [Nostoc sp. TCL26-01]
MPSHLVNIANKIKITVSIKQVAIVFVSVNIPPERVKTFRHINDKDAIALQEIEISRVPCVGEFIRYKGHDCKLTKVVHNIDINSRNSFNIINPEAFIDVLLCDS